MATTAAMAGTLTFRERYDQIKTVEQRKDDLIEELVREVERLDRELLRATSDSERELESSRMWHSKFTSIKDDAHKKQAEMERNPFILVLLDGDGMIFEDKFLQKAEEGGKEAGSILSYSLREFIQREMPYLSHDIRIVVRIYANTKGLARACALARIVESPSYVEQFAKGFTQSQPLFDFVDTGEGKERADYKIKELFQLHLNDCHCRQIYLGASHDNGYARPLETLLNDDRSAASKVTLIEGPPFAAELAQLTPKLKVINFPDLFRQEKVPTTLKTSTLPSYAATAATFVPASASPPTTRTVRSTSPHSAATTNTSSRAAYPANTVILLNSKGQRIDPPLKVDQREVQFLKPKKLCNNFHLLGDCSNYMCSYNHDMKLSEKQFLALRYIARLAPCSAGLNCDDFDCISGHRCLNSPCTFQQCRFSNDMHHVDMAVAKRLSVDDYYT
ncbi:MAG: hypothetical protein M1840_000123 [Geoglossum simile]|nr:MAG: hypothetical protein M1840_000123 [Geoglossum simile]